MFSYSLTVTEARPMFDHHQKKNVLNLKGRIQRCHSVAKLLSISTCELKQETLLTFVQRRMFLKNAQFFKLMSQGKCFNKLTHIARLNLSITDLNQSHKSPGRLTP